MIQDECLDIRTTTMGISLLDCGDSDIDKSCQKVYDKICTKAENLVKTGEDIEKECAAECGCIVIEGSRTSAAYQDLVGILLANNYSVEVIPMDERRKLKIIIKESEV